jgi:DNA primase
MNSSRLCFCRTPVLLPHLSHRPLTLKRFPDDIYGEVF